MKLAFTNAPFRHNSACVMIKKWFIFKRAITDYYISHKYFLLKTEILERILFLNDLFLFHIF